MIFQFAMLVYQRVSPCGPLHDKLIESLKIPLSHLILLLGWMLSLLMVIIVPNNPGSLIPTNKSFNQGTFYSTVDQFDMCFVRSIPEMMGWTDEFGEPATDIWYLPLRVSLIKNLNPSINQSIRQSIYIWEIGNTLRFGCICHIPRNLYHMHVPVIH